ncbi:MAG: hypothetical protein WCF45_02670 [Photobacterium halotolerans]
MKTNKLTNQQVRSDRQSFDATTFDGYAALYEEIFTWPYRSELEIPMLKTLLGDVSGKCVLDFGCGPGTLKTMANHCKSYLLFVRGAADNKHSMDMIYKY